mmetsp:Transcript_43297/g.51951  ORF Transcript_43297/g.51951 Transcript_43297/m.51951 type:complete len:87 (-) Transcript_43297:124-384(-)
MSTVTVRINKAKDAMYSTKGMCCSAGQFDADNKPNHRKSVERTNHRREQTLQGFRGEYVASAEFTVLCADVWALVLLHKVFQRGKE